MYAKWERQALVGGGTRLILRDARGFMVGIAVQLPGTVWRIYWPGGNDIDVSPNDHFDAEATVIRMIEARLPRHDQEVV